MQDKKNKWKLTDSLKEKIVDLAKKDAQDNVYMGNAFMNLRKAEVSKVAPDLSLIHIYVKDKDRECQSFAEYQMKKRDKLSFREEIKVLLRNAMNRPVLKGKKVLQRSTNSTIRGFSYKNY